MIRTAVLVEKEGHCRFIVNIEGIGLRQITTGNETAKIIETGKPFEIDWFAKGGCWIPRV